MRYTVGDLSVNVPGKNFATRVGSLGTLRNGNRNLVGFN